MALDKQQILKQLQQVTDPEAGQNIVSLERVGKIAECDGYVNVKVATAASEAQQAQLRENITAAVRQLGDVVKQVNVEFAPVRSGEQPKPEAQAKAPQDANQQSQQGGGEGGGGLPGVKHVIAVGAGKGGVGKSTVSVNLAVGLARRGLKVGLLDGDIYGPSVPTLLNLDEHKLRGAKQTLYPFEVHGIKTMTMGKLVEADKPLIWRGPMAHGAFKQLVTQTQWGELDYLIIDLPPGTGDVPLTMAQTLPLTGAIIVCTPQKVAQDDAVRAVGMFRQLNIEVMGVVENMSYFIGDDGKEYDIFGRGGAADMADRMKLPLLGQIPIHMELRSNSDTGNPTANFEGNPELAKGLTQFVDSTLAEVEKREAGEAGPTLSVH
ncbi:MAG: Mrp/NBP35 family ATP-binding protein [Phycisphaeraceae bacterium]